MRAEIENSADGLSVSCVRVLISGTRPPCGKDVGDATTAAEVLRLFDAQVVKQPAAAQKPKKTKRAKKERVKVETEVGGGRSKR